MGELLTTREVGRYLKLRPETVLRKVKKGEVPSIKVGGRFRFDSDEIDEWLRGKSTAKKRILVVDDESIIRDLFRQALGNVRYDVMTAPDGKVAVEMVKQRAFDLIFVDLKMPGMNGAETFRQVRRIDDSVPIVVITGYPRSELMEEVLAEGPLGVIRKPFDVRDIERSTESFLGRGKPKATP